MIWPFMRVILSPTSVIAATHMEGPNTLFYRDEMIFLAQILTVFSSGWRPS